MQNYRMDWLCHKCCALILTSIFFGLCDFGGRLSAQTSVADSSIGFAYVSTTYNGMIPSGDLASRFGYTNLVGGEVGYKHRKGLYASLGYQWMFGERVENTAFLNEFAFQYSWPTAQGVVLDYGFIDGNGQVHVPSFSQRGFTIPLRVGKIFPALRGVKSFNLNCGPFVEVGAQFIQHRIRIDIASENVPYLSKENLKGYDRLTNGFGITQSVGYKYFSNSRFVNFQIAFDFSQNFTQGRRSLNWDSNTTENAPRLDALWGFRVGWMLLLYRQAPEPYYYF